MPTGYTDTINKGATFEEFVWTCARAFGALIDMRDEPAGATIPSELKPSPHYEVQLDQLNAEIHALMSLGPVEKKAMERQERHEAVAHRKKRVEENRLQRLRYEAVLASVQAWTAPSPDHVGLKEFMEKQIIDSIEWDCGGKDEELPAEQTGAQWYADKLARLSQSLAYYEKAQREEIERVAGRNKWINALRASVPQPRIV